MNNASLPQTSRLPMGIDVILRVHDPARLVELDRALLSLVFQSFQPVHPIIVAQSFMPQEMAALRSLVEKFDWTGFGQQTPTLLNADLPPGDHRTRLLNLGIACVRHRFVAFLDADDYMYEDAYTYLTEAALERNAAIAFGNIVVKDTLRLPSFVYNVALHHGRFQGDGLPDLMAGNFCPIHSFVLDRERIDAADLVFDERLLRLEDYEFLLRLCSAYPVLFESRAKEVGVYNYHLDGSNSVMVHQEHLTEEARKANKAAWAQASQAIWRLKCDIRDGRKPVAPPARVG